MFQVISFPFEAAIWLMTFFSPATFTQSGPCMIVQRAVKESSSGMKPVRSIPVNATYKTGFLSILGIKVSSSCSTTSSSIYSLENTSSSTSTRCYIFFLGSLPFIYINWFQMSEANYKGLPNIGATCYINSFIQTLFMTPEFRDRIYEWTYNEKIHPDRKDSILYQLQKLFAKL